MTLTIVISLVTSLVANEIFAVSPWCAARLARWAAWHRYPDEVRAETRAEEWQALIDEQPAHVLKLITAITFAGNAISYLGLRAVRGRFRRQLSRYIDKQTAIIEARGNAEETRINAEASAHASTARLELQRALIEKLIQDPANAAHIERVLVRQDRVALAQIGDLSSKQRQAFGRLLATCQAEERTKQNRPDD